MKLELISRYPQRTPKPTPLLFVHGSFSDARIWDLHFLPYFTQHGYEAHALSLRGHGLSAGHEQLNQWRLSDYVADVVEAVRAMPRPPLLIGHSMGGMIIQKYLEKHGGVAGMVLMGSVPPQGLLSSNLHMVLRHPLLFQQMMLLNLLGPHYVSVDMMRQMLFSKDMSRAQLKEYLHLVQGESQLVAMDMMWFNPLRLRPGQLWLPVLVMGAEDDVLISSNMVRDTARFYRTEAHIIPRLAHAMMADTRWPEAAALLLDWLECNLNKTAAAA